MRNHWLDFLKLTFIMVIAFLHTVWWQNMKYGFLPVEFFFIVSGYFVYVSYAVKKKTVGKFVTDKINRLYPTYFIILCLYAVYSLKFPQFYSNSSYNHWGLSFVREIFLLQHIGLTDLFGVNSMTILKGGWYVSVYFYGSILLYWILFYVSKRVATFLCSIIFVVIYGFYFLVWDGTMEIWNYKGVFFMPLWRGLAGMSVGILLGIFLQEGWVRRFIENNKLLFNVLSIAALFVSVYTFFSPVDIEYVGIICFICLLANAVSPKGLDYYFSKWSYAKYIPDISLEILLLHNLLIPVSVKICDFFGIIQIDVVKYGVYAIVVLMVSLTFSKFIVPSVKRLFNACIILLFSITK